ncbi:HAD hydrolase, family IA, variant 3 [Necator americanus]|uniref:HAD hydrolase, family IA, variant 3 n=1 Tax=Necator americanus TaxID=51031 RepID=W2T785_NECAM|nr:HAD hydrolase, family IA, variant 3 [Necator americanus]ETN77031.1 HAD hydrolase, family IA, variant 3 [Necator americanus]
MIYKATVTHVIFDFDGLLVDTESCYTIANQTMLRKFGREFTQELNAKIMGMKEDEAFPILLKAVGIEDKITPKEYVAQYDVILADMFLKCKAMPGAERLVRHLSKKGVPTAMCSGSRSETFGPRREPHKEWLDLITLKVFCGSEPQIKRGKPHPEPFSVKPSDPSKVLVFEDAPNGGRAAKAAGMKCVMVPNERFRQEAMSVGQLAHSPYPDLLGFYKIGHNLEWI